MQLDLHATDEQLKEIAKAETRTDKIANLALITVLLAVTAGVGYWLYDQHLQTVRLDTQGQRIAGKLEKNYTMVRRNGEARYQVSYWFNVGKYRYEGSGTLAEQPHSYQATIIYDPVNPSNNKMEGAKPFASRWVEPLMVLTTVYLFGGICYMFRKAKARRNQLDR